jgi:hypothetical protein
VLLFTFDSGGQVRWENSGAAGMVDLVGIRFSVLPTGPVLHLASFIKTQRFIKTQYAA